MAIAAFVVFALIGQVLNVFLCLAIDRIYSPAVGVLAFVILYGLVFVIAYHLALWLFDREKEEPARSRQAHERKLEAPRRQQAAFRGA